MTAFDDDIALAKAGDGRWEGHVADGWSTPRGPLGGYVMAIVMRAFEELATDDPARSARSATMHFLRPPAVGPVEVHARIERQGRSLTTMSGRLVQNEKLVGVALAAYSTPWEAPLLEDDPMPAVEPAVGREPLSVPPRDGIAPPDFAQRVTMQPRFGSDPFSGGDRGEVGGWLGVLEERPLDAPLVAMLTDAWFPAAWPRLTEFYAAPTIDLTVHFRVSLPIDDSLVLGRFRSRMAREGFFDEDGELWTPDGTLIAQSRQLALLIGATA